MRAAAARLCLAALSVLGATLLIRSLPKDRRQALSAEPVERRLSAEDAARIATAYPAFTPLVPTRLQ